MDLAPKIGLLTALPHEHAAIKALLKGTFSVSVPGDSRIYTAGYLPGSQNDHLVVLATLSKYGNNIAASSATHMARSFPSIRDIVFVGIAAGVPRPANPKTHVRLGDVVVSFGEGIVQLDIGAATEGGFKNRDSSPPPASRLLQAVVNLESEMDSASFDWPKELFSSLGHARVRRPREKPKGYRHPHQPGRKKGIPFVFKGKIGASNTLFKDAELRDRMAEQHGLLAIEMEGSGLADATWDAGIGYLVVRSSCDYGDANKDDAWQRYAAHVAAAYCAAILRHLPGDDRVSGRPGSPALKAAGTAGVGGPVVTAPEDSRLTCLAWLPESDCIAFSGFDGTLRVFSPESGVARGNFSQTIVRCLRFRPGSRMLIGGDDAGNLLGCSELGGPVRVIGKSESPLYDINFIDPGTFVSAEKNGDVSLWQFDGNDDAHRLRVISRHPGAGFTSVMSPDRHLVYSCGVGGKLARTQISGPGESVVHVSDTTLLSGAFGNSGFFVGDDSGRIWDVAADGTSSILGTHRHAVRTLEASSCREWLVSGGKDRTVRLWHPASRAAFVIATAADYVYQVCLSPEGNALAFVDGSGRLTVLTFPTALSAMLPSDVQSMVAEGLREAQ